MNKTVSASGMAPEREGAPRCVEGPSRDALEARIDAIRSLKRRYGDIVPIAVLDQVVPAVDSWHERDRQARRACQAQQRGGTRP